MYVHVIWLKDSSKTGCDFALKQEHQWLWRPFHGRWEWCSGRFRTAWRGAHWDTQGAPERVVHGNGVIICHQWFQGLKITNLRSQVYGHTCWQSRCVHNSSIPRLCKNVVSSRKGLVPNRWLSGYSSVQQLGVDTRPTHFPLLVTCKATRRNPENTENLNDFHSFWFEATLR